MPAGIATGDEAEAQTVPFLLGIAHPTGFPMYTLAGWLWTHVLVFGTPAWRLGAFTAFATALTAAGTVLLATELGAGILSAVGAACAFAFGSPIWFGAVHANAQSLAATFAIFALTASLAFARSGNPYFITGACGCCGLGLATHPSAMWIVPALAVAMLVRIDALGLRTFAAAILALAAPLLLYAYLPLRSAFVAAHGLDPTAALGVGGSAHIVWDMHTSRTLAGFLDETLGRSEHADSQLKRAFDLRGVPVAGAFWYAQALEQYRAGMLVIAAFGVAALALTQRRALAVFGAGTIGGIAFASIYRDNLHLDRYLIVSFAATAAVAAAAERLPVRDGLRVAVRALVPAALCIAALWSFAVNRPAPGQPVYQNGTAIIDAVARDTPDNAIVVAEWNEATALGYGAYVEHRLGNRIVVSGWPWEFDERFPEWLRTRPVFLFISPLVRGGPPLAHAQLRPMPSSFPGYNEFAVIPLPGGRDR